MRLGRDGYIIPLLVGDSAELKRLAEERGYDPSVFTFVDIADEELKNQIIEEYVKLPDTLFKEKALGRRMQDPLYYAMAMQKVGRADVTFAGIDNTTVERCVDRRSDDDWNETGDQYDLQYRTGGYPRVRRERRISSGRGRQRGMHQPEC